MAQVDRDLSEVCRLVRRILSYRRSGKQKNRELLKRVQVYMNWETYNFNVPCELIDEMEILLKDLGYGDRDLIKEGRK